MRLRARTSRRRPRRRQVAARARCGMSRKKSITACEGTIHVVQTLRLHDPTRRPASWTEIIRAGQFAVFARHEASGVPCDVEGARFADPAAMTCAIVDSVEEARALCEGAVQRHPDVRFDVFESDGRTRPPLLTVTHPRRAGSLDTSPRQMRIRRGIAWALMVAGVSLLVYAWLAEQEHDVVLAIFFGINMVLVGLRLLW